MTDTNAGGLENKAAANAGAFEDRFYDFMHGFEEFKRANDERLAQIEKRGSADTVTEDKVERLNQVLDGAKAALDRMAVERARPALEAGRAEAVDEYKEAFAAYVKRGEEKALTIGVPGDGGYLVPAETESEILTRLTAISPIRAIASVRQVSTSSYKKPVTLTGPVAAWVAETTSRTSATTSQTIDLLDFPTAELYAQPAATQVFLDDAAVDVGQWISDEVNAAFAEQETTAFVTGDGTNKPRGFLDYDQVAEASWAWESIGFLKTGVDANWPAADPSDVLIDLVYALKGVRDETPTDWVPEGKPIWLTEIGCGAVDKGANQPSAFGDPKSIENTRPFFSNGAADALMQRQYLRAHLEHWADEGTNPASGFYAGRMVDTGRVYPWAWDARPYPAFPSNSDAWGDGPNYPTGHWLTGRAGLAAGDELARAIAADYGIDLAEVDAAPPTIHGYVVEGVVSCRDALAPVLAATGLSVRDTPDGLALERVSAREPLAIDSDDVAVGEGALATRRRPDPSETIATLAVGFIDRERDYLAGTVTAKTLAAGGASAENARLVLDLASARRTAERLLTDRAVTRDTLEFALPHSQAALEVGDAVALEGQGEGPFEVTEIRDGATRRVSARAIPPVVEAVVVTDAPRSSSRAATSGRALPLVVAGHLPAEPGATESRLMLAASSSPWPGHVAVHEETAGSQVVRLNANAAIGELVAQLGDGPIAIWDRGNTLTVQLYSGHLASADEAAVLAGANRIAVETDAGDWEVIGFAEAELLSPGIYELRRLLRGQLGTDVAMSPASTGRRVVVLDARVPLVAVPAAWLGDEVALRAYAGATDPTGAAFDADLDLDPVLPLAPVHLRAVRDTGSGDVALSWVRRSRADTGSWTVAEVPLDNAPEAYRVEIFDGPTLVRTLEVDTPTAVYDAADQATDFGAPPSFFDFTVSQLSPLYGDGHPGTGQFNA